MKKIHCLLVLALLTTQLPFVSASMASQAADAQSTKWPTQSIARAYLLDGGELAYIERRSSDAATLMSSVSYETPQGDVIATKSIQFGEPLISPSFQYRDKRTEQEIEVVVDNEFVTYRSKKDGVAAWKEGDRFKIESPLVIDAGFDFFIREQWGALVAGDKVKFQFAVPASLLTIGMSIRETRCDASPEKFLCLRIKPSNMVFAMLVDPIDLIYYRNNQRLFRYIGQSDIHDDNDDAYQVNIVFEYIDDEVVALQR